MLLPTAFFSILIINRNRREKAVFLFCPSREIMHFQNSEVLPLTGIMRMSFSVNTLTGYSYWACAGVLAYTR